MRHLTTQSSLNSQINRSDAQPDQPNVTQPWQAPIDNQLMQRAEQRVIKQVLQALLFENIIEFNSKSVDNNAEEISTDVSANDNDANTDLDTDTNADTELLDFTIKATDHISYRAQGYIHYSFDIIRFNDASVQRIIEGAAQTDGEDQKATLENVISDILLNIEDAQLKDSFIKELRHTLINEIQAQKLSPNLATPIDALTYDQLESYLMAGHPYHPSFKSRLGFDLQDNFDYGPEFAQNIDVVWLAVKKELLVSNTVSNIDLDEHVEHYVGADNYAALMNKLSAIVAAGTNTNNNANVNADTNTTSGYGLIPAHPWQWQNTLIAALQPLLATGEVIYLGSTGQPYRAQQSIRSLSMLAEDKAHLKPYVKPYLKLSMHLINTSSTRILAKHTVMNAAVITSWLKQLVAEDETAQALQTTFLGETVGISLDHERLQARGYQHPSIYGSLGAIWRENVDQYLAEGQKAFPLNGVSYIHPDGAKLIAPWLDKYGVKDWTRQLISVTVPPILHLLFGHGIALECHAQNIVLVHKDGYPVKVLLKDLHDGVRYSPQHLTRKDLTPSFYSLPAAHAALNRGSFIETDDTDGIRDMTVACLFFVAFADIAIFLQTHYQYSESDFWQQVADCIVDYQNQHPEHQAHFERFDVFAKQTRIESLAKRRLFGDNIFPIKYINNPLAKSRG